MSRASAQKQVPVIPQTPIEIMFTAYLRGKCDCIVVWPEAKY